MASNVAGWGNGAVPSAAIARAMDERLAETIRPVSLGSAILFTIFAAFDAVTLSGPARIVAPVYQLVCALGLLVLHLRSRRGPLPSRSAHPIGFVVAVVGMGATFLSLALTRDPFQATGLVLAVVGVGIFFYSWTWLLAAFTVAFVGWFALIGSHEPTYATTQFSFLLFGAAILSALAHAARLAATRRSEALRLIDEQRRGALAASLAAVERSESVFRELFAVNPHAMWVYDTESLAFLDVNAAAVDRYGFTRAEFLAMTIKDIRPAGELPRLAENLRRERAAIAGGDSWRHRTKDGRLLDVEISSHTMEYDGRAAVLVVALDVTARKNAEAAAHEAEARLRSVVASAPVILFSLDERGVFTLAEGKGLDAMGVTREGLLGRSLFDLLAPDAPQVAFARRALAGESGASVIAQSNGVVFETRWTPVRDASGSVTGVIGVASDITERERVAAEHRIAEGRQREIERLEEMDRFKTQLLNTASHELNTPLTPIRVQLHLLKSSVGALDERQQRAVSLLDRNFDRLAALVRDIVDVARAESAQLKMVHESVALRDLVTEAAASFEEPAARAGVALAVSSADELRISADPRRVLQVLFNLIGNALKFTPHGGRIEIAARREGAFVRVDVRDTGAGLTAEQISRLFRPFSQVHDPMQKTLAGTGLGLFICKGIVEQHGGAIACASDGPGLGSTFTFTLPLGLPAVAAPAAAEERGINARGP
ncbi:MAG: sensor histidine kinase [Thermoplasmatota archaeon]